MIAKQFRCVPATRNDIDIWRAANLLIERPGADAAIIAAQRADEFLAEGDLDEQHVWKDDRECAA